MKTAIFALLAIVVSPTLAEESGLSPRALAERNRALIKAFAPSVVTVRYYFQKTPEGEQPKLQVPYLCPNCNSTHYRDMNAKVEKHVPMEIAGFVVGADRVLIQDLMLPTNIIGRIAIVTPSGEVAAKEYERAANENALALKTENPLEGLKELVFTGAEPKNPKYFYLTREEGLTTSGIKGSEMANLIHLIELDCDVYKGSPNTIVIDDENRAVTLTFKERHVLGEESFLAPSAWTWERAEAFHERRDALKARLAKSIFPVYIQLEAKPKDERDGRFSLSMGDSEQKNDIDTIGIALESGKVLILSSLTPEATARLQRMEATLLDGSKAELTFFGSLKKFGALLATFAPSVAVEPLQFARCSAIEYLDKRAVSCLLKNRGRRIDLRDMTVGCHALKRIENNESIPEFDSYSGLIIDYDDRESGSMMIVDELGSIVSLALANRQERSSYSEDVVGSKLLALVSAPELDLENVPRKESERRRVAWFGADVQVAGADIIRAKKATSYLNRWTERAPLVTAVAQGSPAFAAGVKEGDILVSVRPVGSEREEPLSVHNDYASRIDWAELFEQSEFVDVSMLSGITPWQSLESGLNETFAKFGIGTEVEVAWVRDGERMTGKCTLALAPVHFENAPKKRNKDLGMTVCDMTDEVRKYFKLDAESPGVIITKLKSGGPSAVAGLKPFELITEIDGVGVKDAKDFAEKTKDRQKLTFAVRRLTTTRVVPIGL